MLFGKDRRSSVKCWLVKTDAAVLNVGWVQTDAAVLNVGFVKTDAAVPTLTPSGMLV